MNADDIDIVIPAYNAERSIEATLQSAITLHPRQIIVVDDGSEDDTARIAVRSGASVLRQQNRGAAAARMAGLAVATSDFVLFLDADDRCDGPGVFALLEALRDDQGALAAVGLVRYEALGRSAVVRSWRESVTVESLLARAQPPAPPAGILWRRAAVVNAQEMPVAALNPRYAEDYELVLRVASLGRIIQVDREVCTYRILGGKSSKTPLNSLRDAEIIRRYYSRINRISITERSDRQLRARALMRQRFELKVADNRLRSSAKLIHAILLDPLSSVAAIRRRLRL